MNKTINTLKAVAFVTYKEWAAYRTHSMVSILTGPLYFCVQVFIWNAVYSSQETINGMELNQMILYFAVSTLIHYLTMDFADWNLQMLIHTGKFTTYLLRPLNHAFFAFSQKAGHRVLGLLYEFIPVLALITFLFKINLFPANFLWTLISIILSFFIVFCINYCLGISGFWLTRTNGLCGVFHLFRHMFSGALIPLTFFPLVVQQIMFYMPFQYITYVPAQIWLGDYRLGGIEYPIWQIVSIQAGYAVILFILIQVLYKMGIKKFTGIGT